ncbi:MAG TPA: cbb3-type cytochrome c oxidase subunit II [Candidatus Polarisedimenticolaceae bacterium]
MRSTLARNSRGIAAVAATYALFLLHTQFGFLEQARRVLDSPEKVRVVMACMGIAGLAASGVSARFAHGRDAVRLARGLLAASAAIAVVSVAASGFVGLCSAAGAIGASMGGATVALALALPALLPAGRAGLSIGLGTGIAYFASNLPWLFEGSTWTRAAIPAAFALAVAAALRPAAGPATVPARGRGVPLVLLVAALGGLVALDACAFAVIQTTPGWKEVTWGGPARTLLQGSAHLLAAIAAGVALDTGALAGLLVGTWGLFALAFGWLLSGSPLAAFAGPLYAAGISTYSAALVFAPAFAPRKEPAALRAALLFGLAGWAGSAAGVGAAQDVGTIPVALIAIAGGFALVAALAAAGIRAAAFARTFGATAAIGALGGFVAWTTHLPPHHEAGAPPSASRGREVYVAEGCVHCHSQYVRPGTRDETDWGPYRPLDRTQRPLLVGNRRQGPDLANVGLRRAPAWQTAHLVDPRGLAPGSRMPSYAHLFRDGRGADLVAYLSTLGYGGDAGRAAAIADAPTPDLGSASSARGAALFATYCAACHGAAGRGDGPLAPRLGVRPADLASLQDRTPAGLYRSIRFGRAPTPMPGHETLPERDLADLVAFVSNGARR